MLQHNKNKYEMEFSLNQQRNLCKQSFTMQDNKLKKQFLYQNMQFFISKMSSNLCLEIEKERNEYETKIYIKTVEKLNMEIDNLLNDIRKLKNNEEHSSMVPRNVLGDSRTFHRRRTEELEFNFKNSYIDQNSRWGKNSNERNNENNYSHELKLDEVNNEKKVEEEKEIKVRDKEIEIKVTKNNENKSICEETKYEEEQMNKVIDALSNFDMDDSRNMDF